MPDALIRLIRQHPELDPQSRHDREIIEEVAATMACKMLRTLEPPEAFLAITKYLSALNYKVTNVGADENVGEQIMRQVSVSYERLRLACQVMARLTSLVPGEMSLGSTHFELEETGR